MTDHILTAKNYLSFAQEKIEQELLGLIKPDKPQEVFEAMRYALLGGGKRFRACLVLLGAFEREELAIPAACAVEMIHAYSLIHDDLPCMDDDDMRRGKPSCHKAFGEAIALLAGDALLTKAFETVADLQHNATLASKELAFYAGANGMVGGQVLDLEAENKKISVEDLQTIHAKKTGALIIASLRIGALASQRETLVQQYTAYGEKIGLAFQITDDILDVVGTAESLGKTPGKDAKHRKSTYTTLLGLERAKLLARETVEIAKNLALGLPGEKVLVGLADFILVRNN